MKSTLALVLVVLAGCTNTTKGEGPSSSSTSSSSGGISSSTSSGGSSGTSGTSTSSSGSVSNSQCQSTCLSKVNECNPGNPDAFTQCQDLCGSGSYSQSQLNCFQSASCDQLRDALFFEDVCPP